MHSQLHRDPRPLNSKENMKEMCRTGLKMVKSIIAAVL